ncbi:hypothetical protein BZL30_9220 [Mycobacterium kansasii]|uniref:Uncharacterized protein n=1 Tax=Mycobacterium kansasii TaxID=1768 RepID=A0A1V3WAZ7_MYCKA|nr:hypothetical protein BZL30_9220 [Mycobacterium kansasii]OOK76999.1 hypothetical protein BZL29_3531 [Mycobacterium kansasii]
MPDTDNGGWVADADAPAPTPNAMPRRRPQPTQDARAGVDERLGDDTDVDMYYVRKLRSEARGLRTRAQEAETERDTLRAALDAYHRGEVERLAASELRDPRDLLDRHQLDDFIVDGSISVDAVRTAAQALIADRPHLAAAPPVSPHRQIARSKGSSRVPRPSAHARRRLGRPS